MLASNKRNSPHEVVCQIIRLNSVVGNTIHQLPINNSNVVAIVVLPQRYKHARFIIFGEIVILIAASLKLILVIIECQIERSGFPCSCGPGCQNPNGRKVFDASEVSMHYLNTMMTVKAVL